MGLNLKEKLQNVNKKNLIILVVILLLIILGIIGIVEYLQYKNFKQEAYQAKEEQIIKEIFGDKAKEDKEPPTKKPSEYKIGISYDKAMKSKKPVLALFYADWCGYCIRFMPVYQELSEKYKKDMNFAKVNVEDPKYKSVVDEVGITGFPTVFIIDPKYDNRILISNAILGSVDTISPEIDRFLRIRKLLDEKK